MSKVAILVGSPRKNGNTEILVNYLCEGLKVNNNEIDMISIRDWKINPCLGCNCCFENGGVCVQKDGMNELYNKLQSSDIIVIASPVYFYGISAQLKCIIDRLHNPIRNTFKVKKMALISVAGDTRQCVFNSIKYQYEDLLKYFNLENLGEIIVYGVRHMNEISEHKDELQKAFELGKSIK